MRTIVGLTDCGLNCFQAFFQRWWRQQSETMRVKVKELVDSGQLEFMYDFHKLIEPVLSL